MESIMILLYSLRDDTLQVMVSDLQDTIDAEVCPETQKAVLIEWVKAITDELDLRYDERQAQCEGDCENCQCKHEEEVEEKEPVKPVSRSKSKLN